MFMRPEKNGYFYIYYYQENGKRNKISTKVKTVSKANAFFSNFKKEFEDRKNQKIKVITLKELKQKYLESLKNIRAESTIRTKKYSLKAILRFFGEETLLKKIRQDDIRSFLDYLLKFRKVSTVREYQTKIITLINFSKDKGYLPKTFEYKPIKLKVTEKLPVYFNREQFLEFYQKCKNEDIKDVSAIAFLTGLRQGNLVSLKWEKVDLERNQIIITQEKTRNLVTLPLNNLAIEILKRRYLKHSCNMVFTYFTKRRKEFEWSTSNLRLVFRKEVKRIFGPDCPLTFHSLRHGFASALVFSGVPIFTISKLLGHRSLSSTQIYTHLESRDLKTATDLLSDLKINTN